LRPGLAGTFCFLGDFFSLSHLLLLSEKLKNDHLNPAFAGAWGGSFRSCGNRGGITRPSTQALRLFFNQQLRAND
jgi:hypothetical protein